MGPGRLMGPPPPRGRLLGAGAAVDSRQPVLRSQTHRRPSYHYSAPTVYQDSTEGRIQDVKIKNHGLGQYGAEPHYSTLLFLKLCTLKV